LSETGDELRILVEEFSGVDSTSKTGKPRSNDGKALDSFGAEGRNVLTDTLRKLGAPFRRSKEFVAGPEKTAFLRALYIGKDFC